MSYFKLIYGIKEIFDADSRVKTITEGDIDDLDAYRQNIPTMVHIVVNSGNDNINATEYDVVVSVLDIVSENNNITTEKFTGNDDRQEVFNRTQNIARRFLQTFRKQAEADNNYIVESPSYNKVLDEQTQNRLAGWDLSFTVGVPDLDMDICETV